MFIISISLLIKMALDQLELKVLLKLGIRRRRARQRNHKSK
jgi:hypothetical protein